MVWLAKYLQWMTACLAGLFVVDMETELRRVMEVVATSARLCLEVLLLMNLLSRSVLKNKYTVRCILHSCTHLFFIHTR